MSDFLVRRDDLRECRVAESEPPALGPGQALLRVDAFGLTSNNITYAVLGDLMSYWSFFPADDGWGRIPVWGFAEVERSEAPELEVGSRVYGYLPPSTHLVVEPADVGERGFSDGSPHRRELPATYQRFASTVGDPFYAADTEDLQMLLRPLFMTAFLIADQLADEGATEAGPVVISSASSKTAIATAFLLAQRDGVELVGLTSGGNSDFVAGLGIYGRTVAYDEIDSLEPGPATFVDIAGDGRVRQAVHAHFGDHLARSMTVGVTHWEELGAGEGDLPGPEPAMFFAPDRASKRSHDWGPAGLESRAAESWQPFADWIGGWLEIVRGEDLESVPDAYLALLEGRVGPATAHVIAPTSA